MIRPQLAPLVTAFGILLIRLDCRHTGAGGCASAQGVRPLGGPGFPPPRWVYSCSRRCPPGAGRHTVAKKVKELTPTEVASTLRELASLARTLEQHLRRILQSGGVGELDARLTLERAATQLEALAAKAEALAEFMERP